MEIDIFDTYDELSHKAGNFILHEIQKNKNLLLCAATGGSPTGTYNLIGKAYKKNSGLFDHLRVIKLDEWGGIPMDHPATCETYLQTHLIQPLQIQESRYISFKSNPENPLEECELIREKLEESGTIDLCILGLGMNGHLALNEPAGFLHPHCHVAELSSMSLQHQMISEMQTKPSYGLTLGMSDILQSKKIVILINGAQKKSIVSKFFKGKITTSLPASFLWLHPNVYCLIVKDSIE
jgi:galactosamine-6-phosphate isomerase